MPELAFNDIRIKDPALLSGSYSLTEKDKAIYARLIADGREQEAIDLFIENYIGYYNNLYDSEVKRYLEYATKGEIEKSNLDKLLVALSSYNMFLEKITTNNFSEFASIYSKNAFKTLDITNPTLKNTILNETIGRFETLTKNAMTQTRADVLASVRSIQRDIIIENQKIVNMNLIGDTLDKEIARFQKQLKKLHKGIFDQIENGTVLKSSRLSDGKTINYKLSSYSDMSIRTTLLNVDRVAVEVTQQAEGAELVEYYQRDFRTVLTDRPICQNILHGKALLALNQEAAKKYGVPTITEVRAEGAMGVYCRHSIKPYRMAVNA